MPLKITATLKDMTNFYKIMDDKVFNVYMSGSSTLVNISSNIYQSISETLHSINLILQKDNVSDAYILLRKYFDFICLDLYLNIYSRSEIGIDDFFDNDILNWIKGKDSTKGFNFANNYILENYPYLMIKNHFYPNDQYKLSEVEQIRKRCNYSTHFNEISYFFTNMRKEKLNIDNFLEDLTYIFKYHLSILITVAEVYFASTDYIDHLEIGITPIEGSQYWVPDFFQKILNKYIRKDNEELYNAIKKVVMLELT